VILTTEFVVKAPVETLWSLLDQIETFVPCMPGAYYIARDGEDHRVGVRMKVGIINTHFNGTVRYLEKDAANRTVTIRGTGKDVGGKASASATVVAALEPLPDAATRVVIKTDLAITGRLAQFGSGVLTDIAGRLIAQFAQNLQRKITETQATLAPSFGAAAASASAQASASSMAQAPAQSSAPAAATEPPALDLTQVMLPTILNFVRSYVAIPAVFFMLGWLAARYL
jgi:carbon monoxide dehydrogenase subunit G